MIKNLISRIRILAGAVLFFAVSIYAQNPPLATAAASICPDDMAYGRIKVKPTVIKEFCIDKYEYPNKQCEEPMTEVSWYKAGKLCEAQGKRLCTDGEWTEACRGCNKETNIYPYGEQYDPKKCNSKDTESTESGSMSECASTYGVFDMTGNVAEWTGGTGVGSMGGHYQSGSSGTCTYWEQRSFKIRYKDVGFRCCKTLSQKHEVNPLQITCPEIKLPAPGKNPCIEDTTVKDTDKDGIPDSIDKCPLLPEDKDGFQDEDGCPDYDNDQDGIVDSIDKCPNEREDFDGYRDNDGCPDYDNDNDGIPDSVDRCPDMPGVPENGGCPAVEKKPELKIEIKKPMILKGVNFQTNSAEFLDEAYQNLELTYQTLADNPDIVVEIHGHTDNVGGAKANMELSQRRADAVRDYLIKRGIAPSRLIAIGKGLTTPIASNRTAEGRKTNRRVELYRIK